MSQTQFGSAPENLKEFYQTVTAYFKAANITESIPVSFAVS